MEPLSEKLNAPTEINGNAALTVSNALLSETFSKSDSVVTRQITADLASSLGAGIIGTAAWSLTSQSKYGRIAQVLGTALSAAATKVALKCGIESALLPSDYYTTSAADFGRGAIDGFAAVVGSKVDKMASAAYTRALGFKSAGRSITAELATTVGEKALENSIRNRLMLSAFRGTSAGMAASLAWSTPHAIEHHAGKLHTLEGWKNVGKEVALNTMVGTALGGVFATTITTAVNSRDICKYARGALQGDRGVTKVDVLHFNDTHSALCGERASLPQLATEAARLRSRSSALGRSSLLLEAGDNYSGNVVAGYTKTGLVETKAVLMMKPDAFIPGNHVADAGKGRVDVKAWVNNTRALERESGELPAIASNLDVPAYPEFIGPNGSYKPYRIVEVAGQSGSREKVGIIGLVTEDLQSSADNAIRYRPHVQSAEDTIVALNARGINKIIIMSHLGRGKDVELAAQLKGKVSAIVGAHTHDIEPVPLWIRNTHNQSDIPVVQAGAKAGWLGELNLAIKADGTADKYRTFGRLHEIHSGIKPHPEIATYIKSQIGDLSSLASTTYKAKVTEPFHLQGIRGDEGRQTPLGGLVSKALLTEVNERLPTLNTQRAALGLPPLKPLQIMLKDSGGIREGVKPGTADRLNLSNVFINSGTMQREVNELCTVSVTGAQLKQILAYSTHDLAPAPVVRSGFAHDLRAVFTGRKTADLHDHSGNFLQVEGVRYSFDRSLPVERRIVSAEVFDPAANRFVPIENGKTYETLTLFHPVDKWGKTGMLTRDPASPRYNSAENWVFGKRLMSPDARAAAKAQPVNFSQVDLLASYLERLGTVSPKNFLSPNAIKDLTPHPRIPALQPSTVTTLTAPLVDAFDNTERYHY